jgi:hypothetical protein
MLITVTSANQPFQNSVISRQMSEHVASNGSSSPKAVLLPMQLTHYQNSEDLKEEAASEAP